MAEYNPRALQSLNERFKAAVRDMLPLDYRAMVTWLQGIFDISTPRNVEAWFDRGGTVRRNYLSPNTPRSQKPYRILFAEAFLGDLQSGRPINCKDFYLVPEGDEKGLQDFLEYFRDNYVGQNLDIITVDSENLTLCYATESSDVYDADVPIDMDNPLFDEFRSGREEE